MSETQTRFQEGARLRFPIFDAKGVLLLKAGALLTPHLVELFERRGIHVALRAELEMVAGAEPGRRIPISGATLTIGRHADCDVRPASKLVSGLHCRLHRSAFELVLEDLKSTNGTFVNRRRVGLPLPLHDGDCLLFGDMAARIHMDAALEGDESAVEAVAGLILGNSTQAQAVSDELLGGATLTPSPLESLRIHKLVEGALEKTSER